jgi:hypothetical protein
MKREREGSKKKEERMRKRDAKIVETTPSSEAKYAISTNSVEFRF